MTSDLVESYLGVQSPAERRRSPSQRARRAAGGVETKVAGVSRPAAGEAAVRAYAVQGGEPVPGDAVVGALDEQSGEDLTALYGAPLLSYGTLAAVQATEATTAAAAGGGNAGLVVGIIIACLVVVILAAVLLVQRRRKDRVTLQPVGDAASPASGAVLVEAVGERAAQRRDLAKESAGAPWMPSPLGVSVATSMSDLGSPLVMHTVAPASSSGEDLPTLHADERSTHLDMVPPAYERGSYASVGGKYVWRESVAAPPPASPGAVNSVLVGPEDSGEQQKTPLPPQARTVRLGSNAWMEAPLSASPREVAARRVSVGALAEQQERIRAASEGASPGAAPPSASEEPARSPAWTRPAAGPLELPAARIMVGASAEQQDVVEQAQQELPASRIGSQGSPPSRHQSSSRVGIAPADEADSRRSSTAWAAEPPLAAPASDAPPQRVDVGPAASPAQVQRSLSEETNDVFAAATPAGSAPRPVQVQAPPKAWDTPDAGGEHEFQQAMLALRRVQEPAGTPAGGGGDSATMRRAKSRMQTALETALEVLTGRRQRAPSLLVDEAMSIEPSPNPLLIAKKHTLHRAAAAPDSVRSTLPRRLLASASSSSIAPDSPADLTATPAGPASPRRSLSTSTVGERGLQHPSVLFPGALAESPVVHVSSPDGMHGLAELVRESPGQGAAWRTKWSPMPSPATATPGAAVSPRFEWEHDMTPQGSRLPSMPQAAADPAPIPRMGRLRGTPRSRPASTSSLASAAAGPGSPLSPGYLQEKTRLEQLRDLHEQESQELARLRQLAAAEEAKQAEQRAAMARLQEELIQPLPGVRSEAALAPTRDEALRRRLDETRRREDVLATLRQARAGPPPQYRQY